jgi:hypothetical protein
METVPSSSAKASLVLLSQFFVTLSLLPPHFTFVCLSVYLFIYVFIYLFVSLSFCFSVCLYFGCLIKSWSFGLFIYLYYGLYLFCLYVLCVSAALYSFCQQITSFLVFGNVWQYYKLLCLSFSLFGCQFSFWLIGFFSCVFLFIFIFYSVFLSMCVLN